jgi:hypothetical protein
VIILNLIVIGCSDVLFKYVLFDGLRFIEALLHGWIDLWAEKLLRRFGLQLFLDLLLNSFHSELIRVIVVQDDGARGHKGLMRVQSLLHGGGTVVVELVLLASLEEVVLLVLVLNEVFNVTSDLLWFSGL